MYIRLPSIRQPQSFYDIFGVSVIGVVIAALVLSIWHGTFVRFEMVMFITIVFLWDAWAINRILDKGVNQSNTL